MKSNLQVKKVNGQVTLEMLIVLAAAVSFLAVFLPAAGSFSNKALERSELQTQKTAFTDITYYAKYASGQASGVGFKRQVFLVETATFQTSENELEMNFKTFNNTYTFKEKIPEKIFLNFNELSKGTHYVTFKKQDNKVNIEKEAR